MLNRVQLRDILLAHLGREVPASATALELREVALAVNKALQALWTAGPQYFLRRSVSVTLISGQAVYSLGTSLQDVKGPVRGANGEPLRQYETRADFDSYALEVVGATARASAPGLPWGCLIEYQTVATPSTSADTSECLLSLVPAPNAAAVTAMSPVTVEGVAECPSYSEADLATTAVLPVPDAYAESFLLPLARRELVRSPIFSRPEMAEVYERDGAEVMGLLMRREVHKTMSGDVGAQSLAKTGMMVAGGGEGGRGRR